MADDRRDPFRRVRDRARRQRVAADPGRTRYRYSDWLVLVTTLRGINLMGLSRIVVGLLAGSRFIAGCQILTEERGKPSERACCDD